MRRAVTVALGSDAVPVGIVRFDAQGARQSAAFQYQPGWLAAPDRFAIDPALPLVAGPQFRKKAKDGSTFPSAIADAAPDGWACRVILRDHAKRRRAGEAVPAQLSDLDYLLAVDDESRVGALRFQDEHGVCQRASEPWRRRSPPLVELGRLLAASRAVEIDNESSADLAYLRGRGTSLGGMRPKCTVIDDDGRLAIGKFPSVADERAVTRGEVLALRLAARAGIHAARAELVKCDGLPVALIRRFDRDAAGARVMYVCSDAVGG